MSHRENLSKKKRTVRRNQIFWRPFTDTWMLLNTRMDAIHSRSSKNTNDMTSQTQLVPLSFLLGVFDIKVIAIDNSLSILNVKASLKRILVKHFISLRLPSSMLRTKNCLHCIEISSGNDSRRFYFNLHPFPKALIKFTETTTYFCYLFFF